MFLFKKHQIDTKAEEVFSPPHSEFIKKTLHERGAALKTKQQMLTPGGKPISPQQTEDNQRCYAYEPVHSIISPAHPGKSPSPQLTLRVSADVRVAFGGSLSTAAAAALTGMGRR